jgi:2C-methyl-D-erythritol 2,4-cyclodiphosphate synthase
MRFRIGTGFDVHQFAAGRKLISVRGRDTLC